jgi:hypothetical protein
MGFFVVKVLMPCPLPLGFPAVNGFRVLLAIASLNS